MIPKLGTFIQLSEEQKSYLETDRDYAVIVSVKGYMVEAWPVRKGEMLPSKIQEMVMGFVYTIGKYDIFADGMNVQQYC